MLGWVSQGGDTRGLTCRRARLLLPANSSRVLLPSVSQPVPGLSSAIGSGCQEVWLLLRQAVVRSWGPLLPGTVWRQL